MGRWRKGRITEFQELGSVARGPLMSVPECSYCCGYKQSGLQKLFRKGRSKLDRVRLEPAQSRPNVFWSVLQCLCRLHRSYPRRPCLFHGKLDTHTIFARLISSYGFDAPRFDGLRAYTTFWEGFGKYCSPWLRSGGQGARGEFRKFASERLG